MNKDPKDLVEERVLKIKPNVWLHQMCYAPPNYKNFWWYLSIRVGRFPENSTPILVVDNIPPAGMEDVDLWYDIYEEIRHIDPYDGWIHDVSSRVVEHSRQMLIAYGSTIKVCLLELNGKPECWAARGEDLKHKYQLLAETYPTAKDQIKAYAWPAQLPLPRKDYLSK